MYSRLHTSQITVANSIFITLKHSLFWHVTSQNNEGLNYTTAEASKLESYFYNLLRQNTNNCCSSILSEK